jgi:hypothetical protein
MRWLLTMVCVPALAAACSTAGKTPSADGASAPKPAASKLGIRPDGDTQIKPDLSNI